jgi:hypothetical protein
MFFNKPFFTGPHCSTVIVNVVHIQLIMTSNDLSDKIDSERHVSELDSSAVNEAVEKANVDRNFISKALKQLDEIKFPAYKYQIIDFLRKRKASDKLIPLFITLNGSIKYKDLYQVRNALEQNNSEAKQENQISDNTRNNLAIEKSNASQKRRDYSEVPATAAKTYICDFCGKDFLTRDDLIHHQEFEFKDRGKAE